MFVLPPPPRYPNGNLYTGMPGISPLLETNNVLDHPEGPEYQLVVGEGIYVLRDSLHLATPPPHPSDAPQPNNNPLAPNTNPPTIGTRLSIASITPRKPPSHNLFRITSAKSAVPPTIQEDLHSPKSDAASTNGFGSASYYSQSPGFGDGNPALQPAPVKGKKDQKAKPKNNIIKSNSSYVSRVIPHESLSKRLSDRSPESLVVFANINRAFMWLDLSSELKAENLTKVLFTKAHVLAHDVNPVTKATNHLDVIMGCNTGDIIWYEAMSQKYARLNKNGIIHPFGIACISWLPDKEGMFVAAHMDGTLLVYDKEKEDAEFAAEDTPADENGTEPTNGQHTSGSKFRVLKSVQSRNQKSNPIAAWKVSNMKLNGMAFSPDGQRLAVVSEDGCLTIIDYINERVLEVFRSYYGAMLCVTWSPDGHYVLTGGQDDLISIWSLADRALVARCVGHHSWVTSVKFDPWRCDERNYRFGSVGEDCRLLLWDFSVGMLGRAKAVMSRNRVSISSNTQTPVQVATRLRSGSSLSQGEPAQIDNVVHAVDSKASAAVIPPVMSKLADKHPLSWIGFEENCIITACKDGHIREWDRPKDTSDSKATASNGSRS